MDRARAIRALEDEGFVVTEWTDDAGTSYAPHSHRTREVRVVVEGSMTITCDGLTHELRSGDRFDINPEIEHGAVVGPRGVRYLAGRR